VADAFVIETSGLRKHYGPGGQIEALRGLDLHVPPGSIHGFLGRNGAGKTTAIKVLLGMARPTSGEARVFGLAAHVQDASVEIRRRTGFVSDDNDLYDYMTVAEMIRFTSPFFPRWRRDLEERYLRKFELPLDRKVKALSRGMRTKLALLLALCRGAELLVLDEPTSGLDAQSEQVVFEALDRLMKGKTTIVIAHHLATTRRADMIFVVKDQRLAERGTHAELLAAGGFYAELHGIQFVTAGAGV